MTKTKTKQPINSSLGRALQKERLRQIQAVYSGGNDGISDPKSTSYASKLGLVSSFANNPTKSVTEHSNTLDEFLETALLSNRNFATQNTATIVETSTTNTKFQNSQQNDQNVSNFGSNFKNDLDQGSEDEFQGRRIFDFYDLPIPRRPKIDSEKLRRMSKFELDEEERAQFLIWRRNIAAVEEMENSKNDESGLNGTNVNVSFAKKMHVTPFEKNLEFWRQLWRVCERSDLIVQVLDARNPLLFRSQDLERYIQEIDEFDIRRNLKRIKEENDSNEFIEAGKLKDSVLLINKADFLSEDLRIRWKKYFDSCDVKCVFFSAKAEQDLLELNSSIQAHRVDDESDLSDTVKLETTSTVIRSSSLEDLLNTSRLLSRNELLRLLVILATKIKSQRSDLIAKIHSLQEKISPKEEADNHNPEENEISDGDINNDIEKRVTFNTDNDNDENIELERKRTKGWISRKKKDQSLRLKRQQERLEMSVKLAEAKKSREVVIGMVGYPNVGKSSVINVLLNVTKTTHDVNRVSVKPTPGHTKHFQTMNITSLCNGMLEQPVIHFQNDLKNESAESQGVDQEIILCDCPGLVFPTFMYSKADLILNNILPIDNIRGRDYFQPIEMLCKIIPKIDFEKTYKFSFLAAPTEKYLRPQVFLDQFCKNKHIGSNESSAAKIVLKDFVQGKIIYCCQPPSNVEEGRKKLRDFNVALEPGTAREMKELSKDAADSSDESGEEDVEKSDNSEFDDDEKEEALKMTESETALNESNQGDNKIDDISDLVAEQLLFDENQRIQQLSKEKFASKTQKKQGRKHKKARDKDPYSSENAFLGALVLDKKKPKGRFDKHDKNGLRFTRVTHSYEANSNNNNVVLSSS